jgi:peptide/nickel transport system ATP-binding protein/oligopeptide transport system ATP-binding protein
MAQEICAKQEPPLMQIDRQHKVACHFAGEYGEPPDRPVTTGMLGVDDQGNPDGSGAAPQDHHDAPGFADTWFDLKTKTATQG